MSTGFEWPADVTYRGKPYQRRADAAYRCRSCPRVIEEGEPMFTVIFQETPKTGTWKGYSVAVFHPECLPDEEVAR